MRGEECGGDGGQVGEVGGCLNGVVKYIVSGLCGSWVYS